jgi:hypothetical protein
MCHCDKQILFIEHRTSELRIQSKNIACYEVSKEKDEIRGPRMEGMKEGTSICNSKKN